MITRLLICLLLITSSTATLSAKKEPEKKKRGIVTVYYPNSKQVWYTGQNSNYLKEGTWTYYAPDGKITHTDNYKAGLLNGERNVYLENILIAKENFGNGKPDGTQRYFYKSGNPKSMFFFTAGNADSARFWNEGQLMYSKIEIYKNKQVTARRNFNDRGYLKSTEYYENGMPTGVWKTYSDHMDDTTMLSLITYKDGKKNGFCREAGFYEKLEVWYVNDTLHGPYKYYIFGKLKTEGTFKKGKLHGLNKTYLFNQSIEDINYVDGKETGVSTIYSEIDGRIYSKRYFSSATNKSGAALVDSVISFNAQSAKTREDIWLRQVNKANPEAEYHLYREWFDNGKLKQAGSYSADWNQYIMSNYYENGKPKSVLIYANGQLNGKAEFWYDNGQKALEFIVVNNEVNQIPKVWMKNGKRLINTDDINYFNILDQFAPNEVLFNALPIDRCISETKERDDYAKEEIHDELAELVQKPMENIKPLDFINCTVISDIFQGGDSAFAQLIGQQIVYPAADRFFKNSGMIILSLTLSPDGNVLNNYILDDKTNSLALQNEALRLMYCTPWKNPSGQKITINIPLEFKF
jgi:antitoxin component YwqK of YwqJK toxin-antitoxin module